MPWWSRLRKWFKAIIIIAQLVGVPCLLVATVVLLLYGEEPGALGLPLMGAGVAALLVRNLGWAAPSVRWAGWVLILLGLLVSILLNVLVPHY